MSVLTNADSFSHESNLFAVTLTRDDEAFTDLGFIDPVGTDYSGMLPGPDGNSLDPAPHYGASGDLEAIAIFSLRAANRAEFARDVRGFFETAP